MATSYRRRCPCGVDLEEDESGWCQDCKGAAEGYRWHTEEVAREQAHDHNYDSLRMERQKRLDQHRERICRELYNE